MVTLRHHGASELILFCSRSGAAMFIYALENCIKTGTSWLPVKQLDDKTSSTVNNVHFIRIEEDEEASLHYGFTRIDIYIEEGELIYAIEHLIRYLEFGYCEVLEFTTVFVLGAENKQVSIQLHFAEDRETNT